MPGQFLNYPFDEEVFLGLWRDEPDPTFTSIIESGALITNDVINGMIPINSPQWTLPYYSPLGGTLQNYDGQTDMVTTETSAKYQSGTVYSRMKGWNDRDFIYDFHGADPMSAIVRKVSHYHNRERQARLLGIANAVFGITGNAEWDKHTVNTGAEISPTDINYVSATALGQNSNILNLALMHPIVAMQLQNQQLLEFIKYTDARGMERNTNVAQIGDLTVVVSDDMPVSGTDYTTYLFGTGAFMYANSGVKVPVEVQRDGKTNGGQEELLTRIREVIHPNGFNFKYQASMGESPLDAALFNPANYELVFEANAIPMAKLVTTFAPIP